MLRDTPGHRDRHWAQRTVLGLGEPADSVRDPLEPRAIVCWETRERLVKRRAIVKQRCLPSRPDIAEPFGVLTQGPLAPGPHRVPERRSLRQRAGGHGVPATTRDLGERAPGQKALTHVAAPGFRTIGRRVTAP